MTIPHTSPNRSKKGRTLLGAFGLTAMLFVGAACSAEDQANDALKDAGVDGNITLDGGVPKDFPSDEVALPDLKLETGVGLSGTFTLRYTTKDAKADVATYRAALAEDGAIITADFDNLTETAPGGNVGFTATKGTWAIDVSAFGPDAPGGGNYLAVVVSPAA